MSQTIYKTHYIVTSDTTGVIYGYPMRTEKEAKERLEQVKKKYPHIADLKIVQSNDQYPTQVDEDDADFNY